ITSPPSPRLNGRPRQGVPAAPVWLRLSARRIGRSSSRVPEQADDALHHPARLDGISEFALHRYRHHRCKAGVVIMAEERVALVTAGGSGMGAAAARRLAADGYHVAI